MRSCESLVPIWLNTVLIWPDDVTVKKLLGVLAQFFSTCEVGSPSVFTCTV